MYEVQELVEIENKLGTKYSKLSKIFLVITILLIIWVILVVLGIVFELGPAWAFLTLDNWVYALSILIGIFVILDVIFYLHYLSLRNKRIKKEKPELEFYEGKRMHVYTHPKGAEGGIYSKTYIEISGNSILRLRTLMIPPGELWSKKE